MVAEYLISAILPDTLLLRVGLEHGHLGDLTIYLRFYGESVGELVESHIQRTGLLKGGADVINQFAQKLRVGGARGMGLRVDSGGRLSVAVYFRSYHNTSSYQPTLIREMLGACLWDETLVLEVESDLRAVHTGGSFGVVGLDLDPAGHVRGLKFDPSDVPIAAAAGLLAAKKASGESIGRLHSASRLMRARALSYLGMKYDPSGFRGWRLYFSCEPSRAAAAGKASVRMRTPLEQLSRMPHY